MWVRSKGLSRAYCGTFCFGPAAPPLVGCLFVDSHPQFPAPTRGTAASVARSFAALSKYLALVDTPYALNVSTFLASSRPQNGASAARKMGKCTMSITPPRSPVGPGLLRWGRRTRTVSRFLFFILLFIFCLSFVRVRHSPIHPSLFVSLVRVLGCCYTMVCAFVSVRSRSLCLGWVR